MSQHGCPERLSNRSKGFQEDGASQPTMEVLVETLTGTAFEMTVSPSDTIFAIKSKICRVEGIPVSQQHLVYNLRELEDAASLHALGIADGARLRLVLGMRGGPISTRRLPPPPEPWRDIERLLDTNRDDSDWSCEGSGSGCRVTVVVFREGERVNMMRVRENPDGSYSPLDHNCTHTDSSPLTVGGSSGEVSGLSGAGSLQQNAVTMGKMLELRRRMETLSVRRHNEPEKAEIQKTRSEETLSVPSLLEESDGCAAGQCAGAALASRWRRVAGRCGCQPAPAPRPATYSHLLPPLAARASSDHSVQDAVDSDRVKLSDALAGSILVAGRRSPREQGALLDPPLPARGAEPLAADIPTGPLACGEASGWRARGFGSSSQLASQRAGLAGLAGALLSSSTSDLEALRRHRILPALHRHNNTETLHLSDEALHASPPRPARPSRPARRIDRIAEDNSRLLRFDDRRDEPPAEPPAEEVERKKKVRVRCAWCRKKLSIATVHSCRCGACYCAPHRYAEVHGCAYDYKAAHQLRAAPVTAPKLPKI